MIKMSVDNFCVLYGFFFDFESKVIDRDVKV